ncbi:MAG TPA: phage holin family protein [Mycobacterium sp.]|jgi:uncharacterized membrane protein YqjE
MRSNQPAAFADTEATSTADLVNRAAAQISTLVRDEFALAKAELAAKGKGIGISGGLLGAAMMLGAFGLGLLVTLTVVALDLVWPLWLAVLVVMIVVFATASIMAALGKRRLSAATPAVPTEAIAGLSTDIDTITRAISEGRSE